MLWLFMAKIEFDGSKSIILLEVILENRGEKRKLLMALDTGATYCMIPWEIADVLGLQPELYKEKVRIITASGVENVPLVELGSMSVVDAGVKNIKVIVHDLPSRSYVDGLLGLNFLRNFNVHLNFKEGILEII